MEPRETSGDARQPDAARRSSAGPHIVGATAAAGSREQALHSSPPRPSALWLQRISLVIFAILCVELGMLLVVLPWTRIWTENSLLSSHSGLRRFLHQGFVRGAISGLGLVDIWLGVWEAVQYREPR